MIYATCSVVGSACQLSSRKISYFCGSSFTIRGRGLNQIICLLCYCELSFFWAKTNISTPEKLSTLGNRFIQTMEKINFAYSMKNIRIPHGIPQNKTDSGVGITLGHRTWPNVFTAWSVINFPNFELFPVILRTKYRKLFTSFLSFKVIYQRSRNN